MKSTHRGSAAIVVAAALFSLITLFTTSTAQAQLFPPQCSPITVQNGTLCNINFCLKPSFGPALCVALGPGGIGVINVPLGVQFGGVISAANIGYPFVPSPIAAAPWWVPNVTLALGCCCDVYYDPVTCTMRIVNTASLPPCNP